MNTNKRTRCWRGGFSLTEMLIATGIMAIGLVLVAMIFPVGVKLTTMTTERTIAAVVADEAFAKIQLYGLRDFNEWPSAIMGAADPNATYDYCDLFKYTTKVEVQAGSDGDWDTADDEYYAQASDGSYTVWIDLGKDFYYPSETSDPAEFTETDRKYRWSALCKNVGGNNVQVTVFVSRMTFAGVNYYTFPFNYNAGAPTYLYEENADYPVPVPMNVTYTYDNAALRELVIDLSDTINANWDSEIGANLVYRFLDEGYTIVNDRDGKIYRVQEMRDTDDDGYRETVTLYEDWQWDGYPIAPASSTTWTETVWVVPPGVSSSRYPCVGVFQKVIPFEDL